MTGSLEHQNNIWGELYRDPGQPYNYSIAVKLIIIIETLCRQLTPNIISHSALVCVYKQNLTPVIMVITDLHSGVHVIAVYVICVTENLNIAIYNATVVTSLSMPPV